MSANCCNKPFDLGCFSCGGGIIVLPLNAPSTGTYTAYFKYLGREITYTFSAVMGQPLEVPVGRMNEHFLFYFRVHDESGNRVEYTTGGVTYDCFSIRFKGNIIGLPPVEIDLCDALEGAAALAINDCLNEEQRDGLRLLICDGSGNLCDLVAVATAAEILACMTPEQQTDMGGLICVECSDTILRVSTSEEVLSLPSGSTFTVRAVKLDAYDENGVQQPWREPLIVGYDSVNDVWLMAGAGVVPTVNVYPTDGGALLYRHSVINNEVQIAPVRLKYVNAGGSTVSFPSTFGIEGFSLGAHDLGPGAIMPRFTVFLSDGTSVHGFADVASPTLVLPLVQVVNSEAVVVASGEVTDAIVAPDGVVKNGFGDVVAIVPSGAEANAGPQTIVNTEATVVASHEVGVPGVAPDGQSVVKNTLGAAVNSGFVPSGTSKDITAPNGTGVVKNTEGTIVSTGAVPSGASADIITPDGSARTTDLTTIIALVPSGKAVALPQSAVQYEKASDGSTQQYNVGNTAKLGALIGGVDLIRRRPLKNSAGTTVGASQIGLDSLQGNTVPTAPDASAVLKDTAGATLSTTPIASGASADITAPNGTVQNKTPSPTYTQAVKSGETFTLPKVRVQLRDGSTVDYDYLPTPTVIHTEAACSAVASITRIYDANDTWTHPVGLKEVIALCIGGGAGGGAGRRGATSTNRAGGGGGQGGMLSFRRIAAADLGTPGVTTQTLTIGNGGAGAPGQTTNSTNGAAGSPGGDTSFGSLVIAKGGGQGGGGTTTTNSGVGTTQQVSAGTPSFSPNSLAGTGPTGGTQNAGSNAPAGLNGGAAPGGGAGGGVTSGNVAGNGGNGGAVQRVNSTVFGGPAGGTAPGGVGGNGTSNVGLRLLLDVVDLAEGVGTGGAGGAGNSAGAGGDGGDGGHHGGGGGGGGASLDGSISGAGGDGAPGLIVVHEIYD